MLNFRTKIFRIEVLVLCVLVVAFSVVVISKKATAAGGAFTIALSPSNPKPRTQAGASIQTYSFETDQSNITWKINGKKVAGGSGVKSINFTAPDLGKSMTIEASVATPDNNTYSGSIVLYGQDIDLLWEAQTYTPVGYKGKALPVPESDIVVSAVPYVFAGGKLLNRNNLIYEWSLNYEKDMSASGVGKNAFKFKFKGYDDDAVTVKVSSVDGGTVFQKGVIFPASDLSPMVVMYEENPVEGTRYNQALQGVFSLKQGEVSLRAEPYYFSNKGLRAATFSWVMNGSDISSGVFPNILSLRAPEAGGTGGNVASSMIELKARGLFSYLQSAKASLTVSF